MDAPFLTSWQENIGIERDEATFSQIRSLLPTSATPQPRSRRG
jgi:hypothetical protein